MTRYLPFNVPFRMGFVRSTTDFIIGLDIMPRFRARTGRPGIALSGYGMDLDRVHTSEAGFAMHLVKPVDISRLREAVCHLAALPTMSAEPRAVVRAY